LAGLRPGRGGGGGRSFGEGTGEGGAGADLRSGSMPAEVVLAAVVSLDTPVDCSFVLLVSDSWFGRTAATRSLAFRDISEGCDISLVATLS
jgi:hypothetical protein